MRRNLRSVLWELFLKALALSRAARLNFCLRQASACTHDHARYWIGPPSDALSLPVFLAFLHNRGFSCAPRGLDDCGFAP